MHQKSESQHYSEQETQQRMNDAIKRALNTPHKPHAPLKGGQERKPAKKAG